MIDNGTVDRHNRVMFRAVTEAGEMTTEMIAHKVGVRDPRSGWGESVLRYGWSTGLGTLADLAPIAAEARIDWLMGAIDDDPTLGPAICVRVAQCPVFRDQTTLEGAIGDLAADRIEVPDRDEMTEFEHTEVLIFSILELAAHAAIEAVVSEYREKMSGKSEGEDDE